MNKFIQIKILLFAFIFCNSTYIYSQKHTISAEVGSSFIGKLTRLISIPDTASIEVNANPVINFAYDYRIKSWFSIGGAFSSQKLTGTIYDFEYEDENLLKYADLNYTIKRMNFAVRPLFHFPINDNFEMYSGFRIGILHSSVAIDVEVPGLIEKEVFKIGVGTRPSFQMIFLGTQYTFVNNLGIHGEIALGAPYYACLGIHYKL